VQGVQFELTMVRHAWMCDGSWLERAMQGRIRAEGGCRGCSNIGRVAAVAGSGAGAGSSSRQ
jgi:hypothetical protein